MTLIQVSPFLSQALHCADIHSGKKGSSTLRNAPFFLKTYCNSTLYVLAVRKLHSTMSFRRCLSVHMFAFLGRQLYFYTAGKRKEERERKNRKESKLCTITLLMSQINNFYFCITKMLKSFDFIQIYWIMDKGPSINDVSSEGEGGGPPQSRFTI